MASKETRNYMVLATSRTEALTGINGMVMEAVIPLDLMCLRRLGTNCEAEPILYTQ